MGTFLFLVAASAVATAITLLALARAGVI